MIKLNEVSKKVENGFGNSLSILENVELEIQKSEYIAICGPSGCGKSTLLSIIGGIDKPSTGSVVIDNITIYDLPPAELSYYRNENIGIVFQKFNLIQSLSIIENVEVPQYLARKGKKSDNNAKELLEIMGLKDKLKLKVSNLSGGEQQRVAIARALIQKPKILLADEPTGSLDYISGQLIMSLFSKIAKELGVTVVLVTHDRDITKLTDRIVYLKSGKLCSEN